MSTPLEEEAVAKLITLITDMRTAQKNYFATKDRRYFYLAKQLERDVDKFLDQINQPNLF